MQARAKSFPTRYGYCYIYPDRLEEERNDVSGKIYRWLSNKGITRAWFLYFIAFLFFLLTTFLVFQFLENYFLTLFLAIVSLVSLYASWVNRNVSILPVIPRNQIDRVIYHQAVPGVSRTRFEVRFSPKKRELKKMIHLPTPHKGNRQLPQSVFYMMKEEGFIRDES